MAKWLQDHSGNNLVPLFSLNFKKDIIGEGFIVHPLKIIQVIRFFNLSARVKKIKSFTQVWIIFIGRLRAGVPNLWAMDQKNVRSAVALDSHMSMNPIVNRVCEGSRLPASYENHPKTTPWVPLPLSCGKIAFHSIGLWYQKGQGPLLQRVKYLCESCHEKQSFFSPFPAKQGFCRDGPFTSNLGPR